MLTNDLLKVILEEASGDLMEEVRIDFSIPKKFEDFFEIKRDKGFLLFKPKKGVTIAKHNKNANPLNKED